MSWFPQKSLVPGQRISPMVLKPGIWRPQCHPHRRPGRPQGTQGPWLLLSYPFCVQGLGTNQMGRDMPRSVDVGQDEWPTVSFHPGRGQKASQGMAQGLMEIAHILQEDEDSQTYGGGHIEQGPVQDTWDVGGYQGEVGNTSVWWGLGASWIRDDRLH